MPIQFGAMIPVREITYDQNRGMRDSKVGPETYDEDAKSHFYHTATEVAKHLNSPSSYPSDRDEYTRVIQEADPEFKPGDKITVVPVKEKLGLSTYEVPNFLTGADYDQLVDALKPVVADCMQADGIDRPVDQYFDWMMRTQGVDYGLTLPHTGLSNESVEKIVQARDEVAAALQKKHGSESHPFGWRGKAIGFHAVKNFAWPYLRSQGLLKGLYTLQFPSHDPDPAMVRFFEILRGARGEGAKG
jgi:hypothetical protein